MEIIRYTSKDWIRTLKEREINKDYFISKLSKFKQETGQDFFAINIPIKIIIPEVDDEK